MFEIRLDRLAQQIVTHFLCGQGKEDAGLYLDFDVRLSSRHVADTVVRGIHLLYHQRPHSAYISVFSGVTPSPFDKYATVKEWKHEVTHDSCWRELRVFSDTYFTMAEEMNVMRKKEGLKEIDPVSMSQFVSFAGIARDHLCQWLKVKVAKDETDERNYRKVIQVLE